MKTEPTALDEHELDIEQQFGPAVAATPAPLPTAPKPQAGIWTLTAPDGLTWTADSPLEACGAESRDRIPAEVAWQRIMAAVSGTNSTSLTNRVAGMSDPEIDAHLDAVLRASGSALRHYSMEKTKAEMRAAMRDFAFAVATAINGDEPEPAGAKYSQSKHPPTYWDDPTGKAESEIFDSSLGRYRQMTAAEHKERLGARCKPSI